MARFTSISGDQMPNPPPNNPVSTFVIRVWREWSTSTTGWRGSVEHLESSTRAAFEDFERLQRFFQSNGMFIEKKEVEDE